MKQRLQQSCPEPGFEQSHRQSWLCRERNMGGSLHPTLPSELAPKGRTDAEQKEV